MEIQTIRFKFNKKTYTFSRRVDTPVDDTLEFILNCYEKVGAKRTQVTCREMTYRSWNFWVDYIV